MFRTAVSQDKGIADDERISRYRLPVIKDSGQTSNTIKKNKAEFEKNFQRACVFKSTLSFQGDGHEDKTLWKLNQGVWINDNLLGLKVNI